MVQQGKSTTLTGVPPRIGHYYPAVPLLSFIVRVLKSSFVSDVTSSSSRVRYVNLVQYWGCRVQRQLACPRTCSPTRPCKSLHGKSIRVLQYLHGHHPEEHAGSSSSCCPLTKVPLALCSSCNTYFIIFVTGGMTTRSEFVFRKENIAIGGTTNRDLLLLQWIFL